MPLIFNTIFKNLLLLMHPLDASDKAQRRPGSLTSGKYQSCLYKVYMINLYMQKVLF